MTFTQSVDEGKSMLRNWLTSWTHFTTQNSSWCLTNRNRRKTSSNRSPQFELLEPRRLLATTTTIEGYEGETAYVQIDINKSFDLRSVQLLVSTTGGNATRGIDYSLDTGFLPQANSAAIEFPIQLKSDAINEGIEEFELTIRLDYFDPRSTRTTSTETRVIGTISDHVVSVSTSDAFATELPLHDPAFDTAAFRFSREGDSKDQTITAYFVAQDLDNPIAKNLADSADWNWKEPARLVGYKSYVDPDSTDQGSRTPVYAVQIPKGLKHIDVPIQALNDHDYEVNERLTFTLVEEFDYDSDGKLKTTEALYEIGNQKAGVIIADKTADLDIGGLNEIVEDEPGFVLRLNNDDDNQDGISDHLNVDLSDNEKFLDNDLVEIAFQSLIPAEKGFAEDYFTLDFNESNVRLWFHQDKSNGPGDVAEVTTDTRFSEADKHHSIWIEGVGWGTGWVKLVWHNGDHGLRAKDYVFDSIRYSLLGADLDIDSDNDGVLQHSDWEDELENNRYGLGKLINEFARTQIDLRVPTAALDSDSNIRFVFDYQHESTAGTIWLSKSYPKDVFKEDDRILPGVEYSLRDLINSPIESLPKGYLPLLVIPWERASVDGEAIDQLTELKKLDPEDTIKVTVKVGNQKVSDEVKYIVTAKESIFWEIQKKPEVRAAIASTAVYHLEDLPYAGLEIIDRSKEDHLRELGVDELIVKKLNQLRSNPDQLPAGFTATVYRNYTSGPSSYLLAFAGTNGKDLDDWLNNAAQSVADGSPQYTAAMDVGLGLRMAKGIDELHATGHSLGGGLASAAVVWAGNIQGYTFNAAGLTRKTIEAHQDSHNFDRELEDKVNALDRYDRIAGGSEEVISFANTYDILTIIQDSTEELASSIGHRVELKGIYTTDLALYFDAFAARNAIEKLLPDSITIDSGRLSFDSDNFWNSIEDLVFPNGDFAWTHTDFLKIRENILMIKNGIPMLIETHSLFDETLLGEWYGDENE